MIGEFGVSPSEYWRMTPNEVAQIMEHHRPKVVDGMHEDDRENILERMAALEAQGIEVI